MGYTWPSWRGSARPQWGAPGAKARPLGTPDTDSRARTLERAASEVASDPARAVRALPLSIQVEDGRLLLRFTRPLAAGRVALDPQVSAVHLWAVGSTEGLSCS